MTKLQCALRQVVDLIARWAGGLPTQVCLAVLTIAAPAAAQDGRPLRIVALGDSLVAGYGLPASAAFPAVLQQALRARGYNVTVVDAGVDGDTAAGGYARLNASVPSGTDGVILELGANDMLRNADPSATRSALAAIIAGLRQRGIPVLLAGMRSLPNKEPAYAARFQAIYPDLARSYGLAFYPFFLQGVAGVGSLNMPDGVHPNAAGVRTIVRSMLPSVERFLARLGSRRAASAGEPAAKSLTAQASPARRSALTSAKSPRYGPRP